MTSMQVKALIRNMAKKKNLDAQILLRNFMLERVLERIANSKYKNNFILKGGMLISQMVGINSRTTIDMDTTVKRLALNEEILKKVFEEISSINLNDNVEIELLKSGIIKEDSEYTGFRLMLEGKLDESKIPIKLDITTGDVITPKEINYDFKLLLEDRNISILAYNLETVLAEKLESILSRSTENTRMRDFYDVHILYKMNSENLNIANLKEAIVKTFSERNALKKLEKSNEIMQEITESENLLMLWKNYVNSNRYVSETDWVDITSSIKTLLNAVSKGT